MATLSDRIRDGVDWCVGLFSAKAAARRAHFRRLEGDHDYREAFFAAMHARGYRSAKRKSGNTPWLGTDMSADGELLHDLPVLRAHQRELERDDPIASGLARTFRNDVIGPELRAQCVTKSASKNQRVERYWNRRKDQLFPGLGLTFGAAQRLIYGTARRDGGVLIKRAKDPAAPKDPVFFEVVELDRLATPRGGKAADADGWITDGVEKDRTGRVVAYWISEAHPRDVIPRGKAIQERWRYNRVPAEDCIHYRRNVDRPGQTFGVPDFYAVEQDLKDIDLLVLASLKRSQIAACLAAFIKSDQGIDSLFDTTARRFSYELDQQIEPGMLFALYPGEEVQTLVPNFPTPELVPFIIALCRRVGVAVGVSWEIVLGGFGDANYSSARTVLLEARKTFAVDRHDFVETVLDWLWAATLEDARLLGEFYLTDEELECCVDWQHQGYQWIDPKNESTATEIDLRTGVRTLRQVIRERGTADWRDHIDQRLEEEAYEAERRKELGLPAKAVAPAAPGKSDPKQDDEKDAEQLAEEEAQQKKALFDALSRRNGRRFPEVCHVG